MAVSQTDIRTDERLMNDGKLVESKTAHVVQEQGKEAAKDIAFGSIAGIVGKFIEYPFDTVKVRLQSQPDGLPPQYKGPLDCFRQSWRADGILGLYRGISAPLVGAAVETSSLFFSVRLLSPLSPVSLETDHCGVVPPRPRSSASHRPPEIRSSPFLRTRRMRCHIWCIHLNCANTNRTREMQNASPIPTLLSEASRRIVDHHIHLATSRSARLLAWTARYPDS